MVGLSYISQGLFEMKSCGILKTHCDGEKNLEKKTKKNQDTQLLFDCEKREESFHCNYKDLYGYEHSPNPLAIQEWPTPSEASSSLGVTIPSDALTATEASFNLNRGMADSRKLSISTNGLL